MPKNKPQKVIYYKDQRNDDFANNNILSKEIDENYNYEKRNKVSTFLGWIFYRVVHPIVFLIVKVVYSAKIVNKKVYKSLKKQGYYIYENHVLGLDPMFAPALCDYWKFTSIVSGKEAFSIAKIVSWMIRSLGAFPIPKKLNVNMYNNYVQHMSNEIKKKHQVLIFPEAHIWPYCNFIRNFSHSSFRYPVKDNAPIITMTTTFKKRKHRKPKVIIYLDGPFYPNESILKNEERVDDLANRAYQAMNKRSQTKENYEYIKYIKTN